MLRICIAPNWMRTRCKRSKERQEQWALRQMIQFLMPEIDESKAVKHLVSRYDSATAALTGHSSDLKSAGLSANASDFLANLPQMVRYMKVEEVLRAGCRFNTLDGCGHYFSAACHGLFEEHLLLMCINKRGTLQEVELVSEGDIDYVAFHCQQVIVQARGLEARYIVICHNHPSGSRRASLMDLRVTQQLLRVCRATKVILLDHLIIAGGEAISIRRDEHFEEEFLEQDPKDNVLRNWLGPA